MLSLFRAFIVSFIIYVQSQNDDICIWGRSGWYSVLNGAYTFRGIYKGTPWYSKIIHPTWGMHGFSNVTYLWIHDNHYTLSDFPPNSTSNIYRATCQSTPIYAYDCGSNWRIEYESVNDIAMFAQKGLCPSWDCDEILTSGITFSWAVKCEGPFDVKIAHNAWKNSLSDDEYWYFHETTFQWICAASYDLQPWSSQWEWAQPGWYHAAKGSTIWIQFTNYQNFTHLQQIDCVMYPTLEPSNDPTASTMYPSVTPTKHPFDPTDQPTSIPTAAPSFQPTFDPTKHPISDPTFDPTNQPSSYPTFHPTHQPSNIPLTAPTLQPTSNPTLIPTVGPTNIPTNVPTSNPSVLPTVYPSTLPTNYPTITPTQIPTVSRRTTTLRETESVSQIREYSKTTSEHGNVGEHDKSNSAFATIVTVFTVLITILIICGCGMMIYRYETGKDQQKTVYKIGRDNAISVAQPASAPGIEMGPMNRMRALSLSFVDVDEEKDEHVQLSPKSTPIDERNTNEFEDVKDDEDFVLPQVDTTAGSEPITVVSAASNPLQTAEYGEGLRTEGIQGTDEGISGDLVVEKWLTNTVKLQAHHVSEYYHLFVENGYDSLEIIKEITRDEQLKDIGINKAGHILKLMVEINKLKS